MPKYLRVVLTLCVTAVIVLSACTSPITGRSLDRPSIPLTFVSPTETTEPEYPLPFYNISPPDESEITWRVYKEWLRDIYTGPIRIVIAPDGINPFVADENGTIVYKPPQLLVDGKLIETQPVIQNFANLACQGTEKELANPATAHCMGTGPFQYNYAPDLSVGRHEATARWEAYNGQIYDYSWSFTLTE